VPWPPVQRGTYFSGPDHASRRRAATCHCDLLPALLCARGTTDRHGPCTSRPCAEGFMMSCTKCATPSFRRALLGQSTQQHYRIHLSPDSCPQSFPAPRAGSCASGHCTSASALEPSLGHLSRAPTPSHRKITAPLYSRQALLRPVRFINVA
jgi:hypothetical protein